MSVQPRGRKSPWSSDPRVGLAIGALAMVLVMWAPDLSHRFLAADLEEATPGPINRVLRHLDDETRYDSDDRLIPLLSHEDERTRQRVLRHVSRLNSPYTSVAIMDAVKAGHFELEDGVEAITRIDNPLSRSLLETWLAENDPQGVYRSELAEHLDLLLAEERRWSAQPHAEAIIEAQLSALAEVTP